VDYASFNDALCTLLQLKCVAPVGPDFIVLLHRPASTSVADVSVLMSMSVWRTITNVLFKLPFIATDPHNDHD
jgi:hypothetical protein